MQPAESRILSFRPFLGALLFKRALVVYGESGLPNHSASFQCCLLHKAATLPGGEDALWMLNHVHETGDKPLPEPGLDPRADLWKLWPNPEEKTQRLLASARSGYIHVIDKVHYKFWQLIGAGGNARFQADAIAIAERFYAEYGLMPLDKLELLASRGSGMAIEILVRRLSNPRLCNDVGRHVFWSFIYCAIHGKDFTGLAEKPCLSSLIARFQLGKCFADATDEFSVLHTSKNMCVDPHTFDFVKVAQEKITLYIKDYKEAEEKARRAIDLWSCGMMKQGLIYDVRILIVKLLWDARWTWTREWTTHKFFKKRAKIPATTTTTVE